MNARMAGLVAIALLVPALAGADSLFQASTIKKSTLIAKENRFEVGDIITVLIQEKIDSSTTSSVNTKKDSTVQSQAPSDTSNQTLNALVPPSVLPNWNVQTANEQKQNGQTKRATALTSSVSCLVTRVDESGNLHIEGDKTVSMNREDSTIHMEGVVRARDVTPANTILSTQVANAQIILKGKGPLWNSQRRGFLTRFLDWFSPF